MKKLFYCLLVLTVVILPGVVFGWGSNPGDGSDYGQLQEKAVFYNTSGGDLTSGMVVILDRTEGTAGTTLGAYVTTVASGDSIGVVGIVDNYGTGTYADDTAVVVITKGVAHARATGIVTTNTVVNTAGTAGSVVSGTADSPHVGYALETKNSNFVWIWVNPSMD